MGFCTGLRSSIAISIAILGAVLALALAASVAQAKTEDIIAPSDPHNPQPDSGWQAGTCIKEPVGNPTPSDPLCSVATPTQFFETAAGHPKWGFTQFIVKHTTNDPLPGLETPVGEVGTIRVDLPVGLSVNPGATERCLLTVFESGAENCPAESKVGESQVTASLAGVVTEPTAPLTRVPVYNVVPVFGESARFGLELGGQEVFLRGDVAWDGDYHEGFTIDVPKTLPIGGVVLKNRLVFDGTSGNGTFITTPTTCFGEAFTQSGSIYSTLLRAQSWTEKEEEEEGKGYVFPQSAEPAFESPIPPNTSPKKCATIPFDPGIAVAPNTAQTDSPSGTSVTVTLPEIKDPGKEDKQATSQVRSGTATMPAGMGLNPSAAKGLVACSDAQFHKGSRADVECPAASKVGTVEVDSPPIPDVPLTGSVYVGKQLSNNPASGDLYRIFVTVESKRYGVSARLLGKVSADPQTGQLTTVFNDGPLGIVPIPGLPQVPFTSFRFKFNGGARAPLSTPPICGPHTTTTSMTPWSTAVGGAPAGIEGGPSTNPAATRSTAFPLTALPGGGACPKTLAERPFAPGFVARSASPQAGAFSPLHTEITRSDGNQELKGVSVDLPRGLSAKLAGVSYCPEAGLAAAAANSGLAERAASSCPASSLIGSAALKLGTGSDPLGISGKVFLSGPYKGAPLSLAVLTPAAAGPFDLGTVVTRVAIFVDRSTAAVHAVSDVIPHVYGGSLLDLRSVAIDIDRKDFTLNPTNCSPMSTGGVLQGGGADPQSPAAFSSDPVSSPFQATDCNKLGFKPKLHLRVFGGTRRAKHPRLRAVLIPRKGDANIGRAAVGLPHAIFLDQSSLSTVCTRPQYAADACPKGSVYGHAKAFSPLLDKPLQGPVVLRSSDNPLPDLVASLRGQVDIDIAGRVDTAHGGIRTTYDLVPDVPVSKFILTLPGGKHGLLISSRNLCSKPVRAIVRFKGQNGKKANSRARVRTPCKGKH
jgi:hypothetical protein